MPSIKQDLTLAHRIISFLEMDDLTYTHVSHRFDESSFLISPFGLLYEEVTEENLVQLMFDGSVAPNSKYQKYNPTGFFIHSAIYKTRPDVRSVIHLHTKATIAVSALKTGLLPLSQHALHFYNKISYHGYNSIVLDEKSQAIQVSYDLANNDVLFLRNHGFITCGKTIQEAMFYAYHLERACEIQVALSAVNSDNLVIPSDEICEKARNDLLSFEKDLGRRDWEAWRRKILG